jgi:hypothetical protein
MHHNIGHRVFRLATRLVFENKNFETQVDKALFYSGITILQSGSLEDDSLIEKKNWQLAQALAEQNIGLTTIDLTGAGKILFKLLNNDHVAATLKKKLWNYASREFARRASGTVTILCDGSTIDSTFRMVEAYELINNPRVTHVRLMHYQGENAPYTMQIGTKDLLRKFVMGEDLLGQLGEHAYLTPREELRVQFKLRGEDHCLSHAGMSGVLKRLHDGVVQIRERALGAAGNGAPHAPA